MKIIKINLQKPENKKIKKAAQIIKEGGIVAFPSDTCYGLAADAKNKKAVEKIFKIKNRPEQKPISVIVSNLKMAQKYALIDKNIEKEFKKSLPGPYTIILPAKKQAKIFTKFKKTISIRIPDFLLTKTLSLKLKSPYTATSANISGEPPAWSAKEVIKTFEKQKYKPDLILDAGKLSQKPLSTIIDFTKETLSIKKR